MSREPHPKLPTPDKPVIPVGAPGHDESVLDEAEEESFPASDPPAPAQPHRKPGPGKDERGR